ncbi:MAG TPA: hypothetical protein VNB94_01655 [Mycobacteriales bacterium]|nr:hypothetical protein [Mycobacteriales bacterium]
MRRRVSRPAYDDDGTALVEFTYLAVLLMIPLVYILLLVFTLQRAAFAVSAAAREAGRAYVTADSAAQGEARARAAAALTLTDHGLSFSGDPVELGAVRTVDSDAPGVPATRGVPIRVRHVVTLPVFGDLFGALDLGSIPVTGEHFAAFDSFRARVAE